MKQNINNMLIKDILEIFLQKILMELTQQELKYKKILKKHNNLEEPVI